MNIISLFKNRFPRRHYGQCQRCGRTDYLPWATEHGVRFCGHCSEKDALEYARLAGWTPPHRAALTLTDGSEPQTLSRQFIIDLIHNEYDPVPAHWYAKDASNWDDGTGRIADAILALRSKHD